MKLSLARVLPLAIALLVPSAALAEEHPAGAPAAASSGAAHKTHATHTPKRAKAGAKAPKAAPKAPKAAKKAPKAAKKAPKAAKKAPK